MKKDEKDKILKLIFADEPEEELYEEEQIENPMHFKEFPTSLGFYMLKALALVLFVVALVVSFVSLVAFTISIPGALIRYLCKQAEWDDSLDRYWSWFRRCVVISLASFVAIFSTHFGFSIFMLYFSFLDPQPNLISKVNRFSSE